MVGYDESTKIIVAHLFLSALIVRYLRHKYAEDQAYVLLFFFDYRTVSQNQAEELFRDLVFQLVEKLDSVPEEVRTTISAEEAFDSEETPPDPQAVFFELANRLGKHVCIIVDGLDECALDSREPVYSALSTLAHETHGIRVHVLLK